MLKKSFTEFAIVGANNVALVVTNLLLLKILTNSLPEEIYGKLQLIIVACTVVNFLIYGPINASVQRFSAFASESQNYKEYIIAIKFICTQILFVVMILICPLIILYLIYYVNLDTFEIVLSVLFMIVAGQNIVFLGIFTGGRNRFRVLIFQLIDFFIKLLLIYFFRYELVLGQVLLFFFVSSLFSFVYGYFYHFYGISVKNTNEVILWKKKIQNYSLPFIKWGLLGWGQAFSERFFLQINNSLAIVAHFSVLFQIGYQSLVLIDNVITQFATPILYQISGSGNSKKNLVRYNTLVYRLIVFKVFCYGLTAYLLAANAKTVILFFSGPLYLEYVECLPLFSIAAIFFVIGQTATMIVVSQYEIQRLTFPKIATSIFAILLNYLFTLFWGLDGMVVSMVIFSSIFMVWILIIAINKSNEAKII